MERVIVLAGKPVAVTAAEELDKQTASLGTTSWVAFTMEKETGLVMSWQDVDSPLLKPLGESCVPLADVAAPIITPENTARARLNGESFVILNRGTAQETPLDDALLVLVARAFLVREEGAQEVVPDGAPNDMKVVKEGYCYNPVDTERAWRVMILDAAERRIVKSWGDFYDSFDECERVLREHMAALAEDLNRQVCREASGNPSTPPSAAE